MKKKKLKKLLKAAQEKLAKAVPIRRRKPAPKPPPDMLPLMQKVKRQLEAIERPVEYVRSVKQEPDITILEYLSMDRTLSMMQIDSRLCS